MRFWAILINHSFSEVDSYINDLFDAFSNVEPVSIKTQRRQALTLIQIDFGLRAVERPVERKALDLNEISSYSGWLKDMRDGRICTALRDEPPSVDPSRYPTLGEFSYAALEHDGATLVTDHYASHPIYYHVTSGRWVLSNDLRLVLLAPCVSIEVNRHACQMFLSPSFMIGENELSAGETFFHGVRKMPPDSILAITAFGNSHRIAQRPVGNVEADLT